MVSVRISIHFTYMNSGEIGFFDVNYIVLLSMLIGWWSLFYVTVFTVNAENRVHQRLLLTLCASGWAPPFFMINLQQPLIPGNDSFPGDKSINNASTSR